jgi:signal transduction histidine kinase
LASICAMSVLNADLARQAEKGAVLHYLGDLAHDIKNKLTPVIMGAQTLGPLLEDMVPEEGLAQGSVALRGFAFETLEAITSGAEDVHRYMKFLADAAKGKPIEPVFQPGDLGEAAIRYVAGLEPQARKADVALRVEVEGQVCCTFDEFLIERAVYNLVNNAIPETPAGGEVSVRVWREGEYAILQVCDTGRGMPRHVLERILAGDAVSTKPGGTGLGTAIVKRVADAHGGRLEGDSAEGKGTAFRLILPLHRRE